MGCNSGEEMDARWKKALAEPIEPVTVTNAKCQDVVITWRRAGQGRQRLGPFPVPISTPGFDNGPYTTCSHWITADLDTGIQNIGNYRGEIKAGRRVGVFPSGLGQDIYLHWKKAGKGRHLPAALVIGAPPVVSYVSVQKMAYGVDEMSVAGALAGGPSRWFAAKRWISWCRRTPRLSSKAISIPNISSPRVPSANPTATCIRAS